MAVYTAVSAEALETFLDRYDIGALVMFKGIAEGVENSNYLVETTAGRFFLTLYEKRVQEADLPYFLGLMTHLAGKGLPVPRPIADRDGQALQTLEGRPACLIEYLPGVSLTEPTPAHCRAAGAALGELHRAAADFTPVRENALTLPGWRRLLEACGDGLDAISAGLKGEVECELAGLEAAWPTELPRSTIHADLFPDNLLMRGTEVTGIIDFYFACTDIRAYDLAVMHSAWCFSADGKTHFSGRAAALQAGYDSTHGLTDAESAAFNLLARGACLRFLLTRAYDWINTPPGALVTRKDPLAYMRRLRHYRSA